MQSTGQTGRHSSQPVPTNAIYQLADAIKAVQGYSFPVKFTDTTRAFFGQTAKTLGGETGPAITRLMANPQDGAADAIVSRDKAMHSTLRTTCVATRVAAGHAENALPQRATANVNCRIFPGVTQETVRLALAKAIDDPAVKVETLEIRGENSAPPELTKAILEPVEKQTAKMWPGVPVMPILQSGATDGQFLNAAGIPTYGISGIFLTPDLGNIHGLNEYIGVQSLMEGRTFLHELVKTYAEQI